MAPKYKALPVLETRNHFGALFKAMGYLTGAEVGVQLGDFAAVIRAYWPQGEYHLVDRWRHAEGYVDIANKEDEEQVKFYMHVVSRFSSDFDIHIHRHDSVDAANRFPNEFFDWIYIDADHSYDGCLRDLLAWYPKLKPGGVFAGHDYLDGLFTAGDFGVKSAVGDFVKGKDVSLLVTRDPDWPSWYFLKPEPSVTLEDLQTISAVSSSPVSTPPQLGIEFTEIQALIEKSEFSGAAERTRSMMERLRSLGDGSDNTEVLSDLHVLLGVALERNGDLTAARAEYVQGLRLNPSSTSAIDGLRSLKNRGIPDV
jgi:hypothetical protein